eukprot:COSAG04_NODE_11528_length_704_cov_1.014876_2_plen_103_part_01
MPSWRLDSLLAHDGAVVASAMRALLPAAVAGLGSLLGTARAACSLVEGACICEDAEGTTWDVTELTASGTADAVASGSCSGSYCSGEFEYFIEICGQLTVPSA